MELANRISPKAIPVWRISGAITSAIYALIAGAVTVAVPFFGWYGWITYAAWVITGLRFIYGIAISPALNYRWWQYEIREKEIEIQHGFFVIERTLIPMVRIQHVDISQGQIMKMYGLSSIGIATAATVHEIPALEMHEAEEMRNYISKMVQTVKDDV
ncbi:MAG: PH domain-containing protein [Bacillus sp. (in: firmicutes)]